MNNTWEENRTQKQLDDLANRINRIARGEEPIWSTNPEVARLSIRIDDLEKKLSTANTVRGATYAELRLLQDEMKGSIENLHKRISPILNEWDGRHHVADQKINGLKEILDKQIQRWEEHAKNLYQGIKEVKEEVKNNERSNSGQCYTFAQLIPFLLKDFRVRRKEWFSDAYLSLDSGQLCDEDDTDYCLISEDLEATDWMIIV